MAPPNEDNRTEDTFRSNLSGFKWARGAAASASSSAPAAPPVSASTPFSRFTNSISGYVPLRSNERSNEEEAYYALSRWERTIGFLICIAGSMICFLIKPRKFAVSFSLGSILFMTGFMVLQGPVQHIQHIFSTPRLPFTLSYFISLVSTLYFSIALHSYLGTLISGLIQVIVLVVYFMAYFPGGLTTLRFMGNIGMRGASSYLPV